MGFLHSAPKMSNFSRPIPLTWKNFILARRITSLSLSSYAFRALLPIGDITLFVHFAFGGHVTRFRGKRCCGTKASVFSESLTPQVYTSDLPKILVYLTQFSCNLGVYFRLGFL